MNITKKYSFFIFLFSLLVHIFILWLLFDQKSALHKVSKKIDHIPAFLLSQATPKATTTEASTPESARPPDPSSLENTATQEVATKEDAPTFREGREVPQSSEGGVFSRRLRRTAEGGDARLRHLSASERQDLTDAQKFLLQLRHPSPETSNEVLCELHPPKVRCNDGMSLPPTLADEWLAWLQKGLAPQQMLVNKTLLERALTN